MENDCDKIILEYRQADENKRLHMFLDYRDLRRDFMEIECCQESDVLEKEASGASKAGGILNRICNRLAAAANSPI